MKKTVLVTGANSMLGTHTICRLIADGYIVRGLLRRYGSYSGPGHRNLELVEGNFTDAETLRGAMRGSDFVHSLCSHDRTVRVIRFVQENQC